MWPCHRVAVMLVLTGMAGYAVAAPAALPNNAPITPGIGIGTATEFRAGAPIKAVFSKPVTISPLRLNLVSAPSLPQPGQRVTVTLTLSNSGAVPVAGLKPVLTVIAGTTLCTSLAGPVPPGPVQIGAGGAAVFAWTMSLNGIGSATLRAEVSGTITGQGVVAGQGRITVTSPGNASLTTWLTPSPLTVTRGQWFTLDVTVSNTGDLGAGGVQPAIQPGANASLVTFQRGPVPKKPQSIPPGESRVFQFTYSANGSGTVSFTVTVTGGTDLTNRGSMRRAAFRTMTTAGVLIHEAIATSTTWVAATRLRLFPPEPPPPAEPPFMSFEDPRDLAWQTDGYVRIAPSGSRFTDGAHAAEITFLVPGDFTLTPTGTFRPTLRLIWPPRGTDTPLAPRDWSMYTAFKSDWYNASPRPVVLYVTLMDERGYRHDELRTLPASSATIITVDLRAVRESRMDLAHLVGLEFGADTTTFTARPVMYLDRLRLSLPLAPPSSATALNFSRSGPAATRPATGRPVTTP